MTTIYIVQGWIDCESTGALRAFAHEADADTFIVKCVDYDKSKPVLTNNRRDESVWAAYYKKLIEWEYRHPARGSCSGYEVQELELE